MAELDPKQIQQLIDSNNKLAASNAAAAAKGGNTLSPGAAALPGMADAAGKALGGLGKAVDTVKSGYDKFSAVVEEGISTFRDLSKTGASFSNDVVGMSVAAASTRMSLGEFAKTIGDNASQLSGLGGNVTRGAEAFSRLSKEMFDSGATDYLKQMGYTSKEINDVLALQVGFQGATLANSKAAQQQAIQSAGELAVEMDELAKLTGKSRKEQEDNMKKVAADMQVEAKLRIMTQGKSEEEAAKIRADFLKNYNEAEARGQGQMFKEVFATGTVQSKEASMQVALQGKAAAATVAQASAIAKGNAEAAKRHNEDATREMGKLNNNTAYLSVAMMGTGEASKSVQKSMLDTRTAYNNEKAIRDELLKDEKNRNLSKDELEKKVQDTLRSRAQQAQEGKNEKGEDVSGATKATIQLGNRVADVNSALMNGLVTPLNKDIGPALGGWSDKYLKPTTNIRTPDGKGVEQVGFTQNIEQSLLKGYKAGSAEIRGEKLEGTTPPKPGERGSGWKGSANRNAGNATGDVAEGIGRIVGDIGGITAKTINTLTIDGKAVPGRATGSLGMTGNLLEDFGKGSLTMLHGKEAVMTEEQLKKMAAGFQTSGIESAVSKLTETATKTGTLDIGQISKDIGTTFSAVNANGSSPANAVKSKMDSAMGGSEGLASTVQNTMSGLMSSVGEMFKGSPIATAMESASPKPNAMSGIDTSGIVLGPNGLPIPGSMKGKSATIAADVKQKETAARAEEQAKKTEASKKTEDTKPAEAKVPTTKQASLDDVVNKLDSLNKTMNRLLATSEDLGNKQVRATKNVAASKDLYNR